MKLLRNINFMVVLFFMVSCCTIFDQVTGGDYGDIMCIAYWLARLETNKDSHSLISNLHLSTVVNCDHCVNHYFPYLAQTKQLKYQWLLTVPSKEIRGRNHRTMRINMRVGKRPDGNDEYDATDDEYKRSAHFLSIPRVGRPDKTWKPARSMNSFYDTRNDPKANELWFGPRIGRESSQESFHNINDDLLLEYILSMGGRNFPKAAINNQQQLDVEQQQQFHDDTGDTN